MMLLGLEITPAHAQQPAPALVSAVIRGVTVWKPAELFPAYRDHIGRPITRDHVSQIVTAIADRYQAAGYPRPQITLDDELVGVGVLRINVFEARISSVNIVGDAGPHRDALFRLGETLRSGEALRRDDLQTTLRRMRSLPGLEVEASTAAHGTTPHEYRLDVDADYRPVSTTFRVTNRGTDDVGPLIAISQLSVNGLAGGRVSAGPMFASADDYEEFHGLGVAASSVLREGDSTLSFSAFRSRANPDEKPTDRDDVYVRDRATVRFSWPVLAQRLTGTSALVAAIESTDLEIARSGRVLRDEHLRMVKIGTTRTVRHGDVEYAGSVDVVKGLDAFGAGLVAVDISQDPRRADFLLARLNVIRLAQLAPIWWFRVDAFAQQTAYTLPYTERFRIGGERLGRGFEVAPIAGDQGIGAKLELRRDMPAAPAVLGRVSIKGFYDLGAAWRSDAPGRESAATAGVAFSVEGGRATGSVELTKPLTHPDVEGSDDARLFFELTLRL